MNARTNSPNKSEVIPTPLHSLTKPYYLEYFIKAVSEIIKFYSSPHRAFTYSHIWTLDELGNNRNILQLTNIIDWNFNLPKISRKEFEAIVHDWEIYQEYAKYVWLKKPEEIQKPNVDDEESLNYLFVEFVKRLEEDFLFYRSYYKLFQDVSEIKTLLYIDLAAYCSTRHFRFLMRKGFGYLEGNYVTSLRKEGKVYIPHLQFFDESVELLYTSAESMELEHVIADYLIKENIKTVNDLLERIEKMATLRVDVAKEQKSYIFLNPSIYIDRDVYINMFMEWISNLGKKNINFQDRDSIIKNINIDELQIPASLFRMDQLKDEDRYNYPSDKEIFLKDIYRAKRRLIQVLFNNLLQYSINRYRFGEREERKGLFGIEERSEYENIFREYKNMSFLEQDVGCLLVECGEISFNILLWRYIEDPKVLNTPEKLLYWGLVERDNSHFKFSPRAQRMARWCMKLMRLKYKIGENHINYADKNKILNSYANLVAEGNLFHWMINIKGNYSAIKHPPKYSLSKYLR